MLADKGYDSNAIRRQIEAAGAAPNIPPKANRVWKPCFSPVLYRGRNAIERMFGRLKDFRRIATRYDRSATNYLAAVCIAATVSVITHAYDGEVQAPMVLRMVPKGLPPDRRAVSTTVGMSASPEAAHIAR